MNEGGFTGEMTGEMFDAIRDDPVVTVPGDFVLVGHVFFASFRNCPYAWEPG